MSNEQKPILDKSSGVVPTAPVNRITEFFMDSVLDGIIIPVKTSITGEPEREPDKTDANGKLVKRGAIKRDSDGEAIRSFPATQVEYKIDLTGSILRNVIKRAINDIVVQIGKETKIGGIEAVDALRGTTLNVRDMLLRKPSTDIGFFKAVSKMDKSQIDKAIETLLAKQAEMEKQAKPKN